MESALLSRFLAVGYEDSSDHCEAVVNADFAEMELAEVFISGSARRVDCVIEYGRLSTAYICPGANG